MFYLVPLAIGVDMRSLTRTGGGGWRGRQATRPSTFGTHMNVFCYEFSNHTVTAFFRFESTHTGACMKQYIRVPLFAQQDVGDAIDAVDGTARESVRLGQRYTVPIFLFDKEKIFQTVLFLVKFASLVHAPLDSVGHWS